MISSLSRLALAGCLVLLVAPLARTQPPPKRDDPGDYRRFFKQPRTAEEYWIALNFEIEVGRYDLAARHLAGLLAIKDLSDADLLKIHDKEGISAFIKLRLIPRWDDDPRVNAQAFKDVETLITRVSDAVRKIITDPKRIAALVQNLSGEPDGYRYAVRELYKAGAVVVPPLITELRGKLGAQRRPLLDALAELGPDTVPPLLAALDIKDDDLRVDLIRAIRKRKDFLMLRQRGMDPAPFLWPLAAPNEPSPNVRRTALDALTVLYEAGDASQLPQAKVALTREAEKYYQHKVRFPDAQKVAIWRWDGQKVFRDDSFNASTAEEYYALRFAKQALAIDSTYFPAQVVFLSAAIDKGYEKPSAERPLGTLKTPVRDLLASVSPELIRVVLDRALVDKRTLVVLATAEVLGGMADRRTQQPTNKGDAPLVRALDYGDRRVEFTAVDSLLRIPGPPPEKVHARMVEILARTLSVDAATRTQARFLVGCTDAELRLRIGQTVEKVGGDAILVSNGKDLLRRLNASSDIDGIIFDSTLPGPGLHSLLAQLHADVHARRLPVLLVAIPESRASHDLLVQIAATQRELQALQSAPLPERTRNPFLLAPDLRAQNRAPDDRFDKDRKKQVAALQQQLLHLEDRYTFEASMREESLKRFVTRYPQVRVISAVLATNANELRLQMDDKQGAQTAPALSAAERKQYAEQALRWLARMAQGELRGYPVSMASDAVLKALPGLKVSEAALNDALHVVGKIPGVRAQSELITVVLDDKRPVPVRIVATDELLQHLQLFGHPNVAQAKTLLETLQLQVKQNMDPVLRSKMVLLVGSLKPGETTTGERLRGYTPAAPGAAPPPAPPVPPARGN